MFTRRHLAVLILSLAITVQSSWGAIVFGGRATNGTLDNSGTNKNPAPFNLGSYVGRFGGAPGTPISPTHFLTATHLGNAGASVFHYNDGGAVEKQYNVTLVNTLNDLAIWRIDGPGVFAHWTHIYRGSTEIGQPLVTIGNGTTRGNPVNTPSTSNLAGWEWGGGVTLRSWGTNTVDAAADPGLTGTFAGDYLTFSFNRILDGGGNLLNPDDGIYSVGDSGGPTFVLDPGDNQWKLAGINSLVEAVSQTSNGSIYNAALFDARGFFDGTTLLSGSDPIPLSSYATRISSRENFLNTFAAVPEPGSIALFGLLAFVVLGAYLWHRRARRHALQMQVP